MTASARVTTTALRPSRARRVVWGSRPATDPVSTGSRRALRPAAGAFAPTRTYHGPDGAHGTAGVEQLTSVCGSFEARVLAARLYDEGIDAELRGALDSPYGFTVGDMARIDVFVPEEQAEDARF